MKCTCISRPPLSRRDKNNIVVFKLNHYIATCEWEEKLVPLARLNIDPPKDYLNMAKATKFLELMQAGASFPPLVCVNDRVIDGFHRAWALAQSGRDLVRVYQNVPWEVQKAAA